jgi:hypothetical protein
VEQRAREFEAARKVLCGMFHVEHFWDPSGPGACQVNLLEVICFLQDNLQTIMAFCASVLGELN